MTPLVEFLLILQRDLDAEDVRVLEAGREPPEDSGRDLRYELPGGRLLVVTFASPPPDLPVRQKRGEMLIDSFHSVLTPAKGPATRSTSSPARSLHQELRALAERAGASDAIVIDARSPVVWGASAEAAAPAQDGSSEPSKAAAEALHAVPVEAPRGAAVVGEQPVESTSVTPLKKQARGLRIVRAPRATSDEPEAGDSLSERAIRAVRALPETATLHKGGHVHHSFSELGFGFIARSFAGIYVLVLAFREPFDELRAKRAVVHALPIIERLVLALPPRDPAPRMGGVVALRPRLRRR